MVSLPNQLRRYRMTDLTPAANIDNHVGMLEQAICDILGLPIDTSITEAILNPDASGRITKLIRLIGTAAAGGLRIRDSTNNSELKLTCNNGYFEIYRNSPDNEATPTWVLSARIHLASGYYEQGTPTTCGVRRLAAQSIPDTTYTDVSFDDEEWDHIPGGGDHWTNASPTRVVIPTDGFYRVDYEVHFDYAAAAALMWGRIIDSPLGTVYMERMGPIATGVPSQNLVGASEVLRLESVSYLKLQAMQNTGGAHNLLGGKIRTMYVGALDP